MTGHPYSYTLWCSELCRLLRDMGEADATATERWELHEAKYWPDAAAAVVRMQREERDDRANREDRAERGLERSREDT